jgi:hypothetical protein
VPRKQTPLKRFREGVLVTGRKGDLWVQAQCRNHIYELESRVYDQDGFKVQDAKCLICFNPLVGITIDWFQEVATLNYVLAADVAISNRIKALEASQKVLRRRQAKLSPREALDGF